MDRTRKAQQKFPEHRKNAQTLRHVSKSLSILSAAKNPLEDVCS
jgi:hypothetical protein